MKSRLLSLLAAALTVTSPASLAAGLSFREARTVELLTAAGFRQQTPATAEQKDRYGNMSTDKVQRVEINGKVSYAYKDEKDSIPYVGDEGNFDRYKKLLAQRDEEYQAAQQRQRSRMSLF